MNTASRLGRFFLLLILVGTQMPSPEAFSADLVITGGRLYTLNPQQPIVEAIAIQEARIIYVGSSAGAESLITSATQVLDLRGLTLIPGLIDAHAHLASLGHALSELDLRGTTSATQICELVRVQQNQLPPGAWITGRGWDQNDWEIKNFPTWRDLRDTEANPVYLRRVDGHAAWVNKTTLEICGILNDTPDPLGGRLLRDEHGNLTGVLVDNAMDLVTQSIPQPTLNDRINWIKVGVQECRRVGLVGVHDAGADALTLAAYRKLQQQGELDFRVYVMVEAADSTSLADWLQGGTVKFDDYLTIRAIKLYADGALGSRGAALLEPYSDDPGNRGLLVNTPDYLYQTTLQAVKAGYQVCTHAIGDAANRVVLNAYEKVLSEVPPGDYRLRLEHAQVISPQDLTRCSALGVIPSMQPTHATSDMPWAVDRLGPDRIKGAYAWRTLLNLGCRLPFGSDFPVEAPNPLWGIYAAVTRQDPEGQPVGGWFPEQRLTVEEALKGFSLEAAYAGFAERDQGSLEVGKLADFTVLDQDPFQISPRDLYLVKVIYTIIGGQIVYRGD